MGQPFIFYNYISAPIILLSNSLRPAIFPSIPSETVAYSFLPNNLSTSIRTDVTGTTRSAIINITGGIYSSPYNASITDRTYKLIGDVTYETAGITIGTSDITIDLNGYTLTYKTIRPEALATGTVILASNPVRPTIQQTGLTLTTDSHFGFIVEFIDGAEAGNHYEVYSNTVTGIVLENHCTAGGDSTIWQSGGPISGNIFRIYDPRLTYGIGGGTNRTGIEVINGHIIEGSGYGRGSNIRNGEGCNPIFLRDCKATIGGIGVTWHADNCVGIRPGNNNIVKYCEVDDQGTFVSNRQRTVSAINPQSGSTIQYCRITNHRQAGINVAGNNIIEYCEIYGDSRATNAYGIGTFGGDGNVWRYNNVYKVGEHPICIALHTNDDTPGPQNNDIYGNWCEAKTTRQSSEYGWNYSVGLSRRWGINTLPNNYYNNCFITYSEDYGTGVNDKSRGKTMFFGALLDTSGEIVKNNFIGAYNTDNTTPCHSVGLSSHNNTVVFSGNYIDSSYNPFWIGDNYGPGYSGGRFINNTVSKNGSYTGFKTIMTNGFWDTNCDFISNIYVSGAGSGISDIGQDEQGYALIDSGNIFRFGYLVTVSVTNLSIPVSGALITIKDSGNNVLRSNYTTNVSGLVVVDTPVLYRRGPSFGLTTLSPLTVEATSGVMTGSSGISPTSNSSINIAIA